MHPIAAIQVEYSPFTLDAEDPKIGALQAARELGVTVFAYSPLGRGLLTGKYVRPLQSIAETVALTLVSPHREALMTLRKATFAGSFHGTQRKTSRMCLR